MKKWFDHLTHFIFLAAVAYLIYQKAPVIYNHFQTEGAKIPVQQIHLLSGEKMDLFRLSKPYVLIFWATWCGPCDIELSRLQNLISNGDIAADSVLAVSIGENSDVVSKAVRDRRYTFIVGLDIAYSLAQALNVKGTPTLILVNKDQTIAWMTTGLSPSLEIRVRHHLKNL